MCDALLITIHLCQHPVACHKGYLHPREKGGKQHRYEYVCYQFYVQCLSTSWRGNLPLRCSIDDVPVNVIISVSIPVIKILSRKCTLCICHLIMAHMLITDKVRPLQLPFWCYQVRKFIGVQLMTVLVPVQLLAGKYHTVNSLYTHIAKQIPQLARGVIVCCI